jgi:hypothetical protein
MNLMASALERKFASLQTADDKEVIRNRRSLEQVKDFVNHNDLSYFLLEKICSWLIGIESEIERTPPGQPLSVASAEVRRKLTSLQSLFEAMDAITDN